MEDWDKDGQGSEAGAGRLLPESKNSWSSLLALEEVKRMRLREAYTLNMRVSGSS